MEGNNNQYENPWAQYQQQQPPPKKPPIDLNKRNEVKQLLKALKAVALLLVICIVAGILFGTCTYTVGENEQAVVSQFGVIKEVVLTPTNTFVDENPDLMNADGAKLNNVKVVKDKIILTHRLWNSLPLRLPELQRD